MTTAETVPTTPNLDDLRSGPPTISVAQSAPFLGVSRAYAYEMAREGRLPVIKLGPQRVRVLTAGLLRMLEGSSG